MGAGKTFLVRAIARALGYRARVTSPTFALVHEYPTQRGMIAHVDLYRLRDPAQASALGLWELRSGGAVVIVEWGEKALEAFGQPPELTVSLTIAGATERRAMLSGPRAGGIV
jgi:tRNA threonylcarbamoyladenosine biosynthesis protein TsaE